MTRPSPGTVIASVALFVALGGTAVAVRGGATAKLDAPALDLRNGWEKYGSPSAPPRYFEAGGVVQLEGAIYGGNPNEIAFKLPKGSRPRGEVWVPVSTGPGEYGELVIQENGTAYLDAAGSPDSFVGLDGVTFRPAG